MRRLHTCIRRMSSIHHFQSFVICSFFNKLFSNNSANLEKSLASPTWTIEKFPGYLTMQENGDISASENQPLLGSRSNNTVSAQLEEGLADVACCHHGAGRKKTSGGKDPRIRVTQKCGYFERRRRLKGLEEVRENGFLDFLVHKRRSFCRSNMYSAFFKWRLKLNV